MGNGSSKIWVVMDRVDPEDEARPVAAFTNELDAHACPLGEEVVEVRLFSGPAEVRDKFIISCDLREGEYGRVLITKYKDLYDGQVGHDTFLLEQLRVWGWDLNETLERFQMIQELTLAERKKDGK